jgi:hypothetical protein
MKRPDTVGRAPGLTGHLGGKRCKTRMSITSSFAEVSGAKGQGADRAKKSLGTLDREDLRRLSVGISAN